jgi:tetrahydromethanopterin S-methyltransferase subunit B
MIMTENVENLVLEHLKHIRGKLDVLTLDMADIKSRVSSLEETQGQMLTMLGGLGKRMDRFDERMSRIEKRLDLEHA